MSSLAEVRLWGKRIGGVELPDDDPVARFEYDRSFTTTGIEIAPIQVPLSGARVFRFPANSGDGFRGLPGLLADSLPDRFGNAVIDAWLASQGRRADSMDAVERLCYVGARGMGALEFEPGTGPESSPSHHVEVEELRVLAGEVLSARAGLDVSFRSADRRGALEEIIRVGSSAGGARAKALIAFNPETADVRSGQIDAGSGYEYWILKFDGIDDATRELGNARGYGAVEFAYSEMARAAKIEMSETRLLDDGDRRHFMTRRFDRTANGGKVHMQSLSAMAHLDYNLVRAHSYEQAFRVMRQLGLTAHEREQMFRRILFNVVARNQDDHVKNISFLMDRVGNWTLAPAYDLTYAYNPEPGSNTSEHQMSLNGMRDQFTLKDIIDVGKIVPLRGGRAKQLLTEVVEAVSTWSTLAADAGVDSSKVSAIRATHRLEMLAR